MDPERLESLLPDIRRRWAVADFVKIWPWIRPCQVRVLLYAEGSIRFNGGPFLGLNHVIATLNADPWYWVKFKVTTAHRGSDASASLQNKTLDQLNLRDNYDEVWVFGIGSIANALSPAEVSAIQDFMDHGGGVLVTGDHANLGRGIAAAIPRVGKLRQWPAPDAVPPGWNTTLVEGPDPGTTYDFNEQSDDTPQIIRPRRYLLWPSVRWWLRWAPHPILCGPNGPITVLPDHQHEGEAVIPATFPASEWPSKNGFQPRPEVIAWGRIKDPAASKAGQEIGVIAAYDGHLADVGRVAADSTWHHFFDINLTGLPGNPTYQGFPATPSGQQALKQIEAYFLNLAVWLASPAKQVCMRNALSWGLIWRERFIEFDPAVVKADILFLGQQAVDALGRVAPQCTVREWLFWDLLPLPTRLELIKCLSCPDPLPGLMDEFVVGAIFARLLEQYGRSERRSAPPAAPPDDEQFNALIREAAPQGLQALQKHHRAVAEMTDRLVRGGHKS